MVLDVAGRCRIWTKSKFEDFLSGLFGPLQMVLSTFDLMTSVNGRQLEEVSCYFDVLKCAPISTLRIDVYVCPCKDHLGVFRTVHTEYMECLVCCTLHMYGQSLYAICLCVYVCYITTTLQALAYVLDAIGAALLLAGT